MNQTKVLNSFIGTNILGKWEVQFLTDRKKCFTHAKHLIGQNFIYIYEKKSQPELFNFEIEIYGVAVLETEYYYSVMVLKTKEIYDEFLADLQ